MINNIAMVCTVLFGIAALFLVKYKPLLMQTVIIGTFVLTRIFFGWQWIKLTGRLGTILPSTSFYLLLINNFLILSLIFIIGIRLITKQTFRSIGWVKDRIFKHIFIGSLIGLVFLFFFGISGSVKVPNIIIVVFFSFFIASWQEENIFRGYLQKFLQNQYGQKQAVLGQAFLYSIAHIGFYPFTPILSLVISLLFAFLLGLIFGFLRINMKSQVPAFIVHGLIDVTMLI